MRLSEARILFVDDEPALLEIFAHWIGCENSHPIATAADGQEALEKLATDDYDLLITDVNMPRVNGPELVRRMAAIGKTSPGLVFVSGYGHVDEREMYALGVEAFLTKPVSRETLLNTMEQALAERSELWGKPFDVEPRHRLTINALAFANCAAGGYIALGRGGFSAGYSGPAALGRVAFECHLSAQNTSFSGQGYLRWRSKDECAIGVEIAYLDDDCRPMVVEVMKNSSPHSFIPFK